MTRIEREVATWPRAWRDEFVERSGILMDSGIPQDRADQTAYLWVRRLMRANEVSP